ncbi:MAG: flagellar export protein FliJ [Clostridiales bacterium]|jgi:flagellar FliJ protein|nr:flagellar export protein FliJ [Clostridiales bacterium]
MPKFVFRLQNYLELKEKMEVQRKMEYGLAVSELEKQRKEEERLSRERSYTTQAFRREISGNLIPKKTENYNDYLRWLKRALEDQKKIIQKAQAEVERRRAILVEAMKDRKALEVLREKRYEEYLREERVAEQKIVDEIVSYRYSQR